MPRTLSLAALTVLELPPPALIRTAAAAGYRSVGLRLLPATAAEPQHDLVGDAALRRETLRTLAEVPVRVLDVEIFRLHPETDVAQFEAAIAAGARLGARHALVAGHDADPSRLAGSFAAFCDLCARHDMTADVEPMPWAAVRTVHDALHLIERAGRPNGGLLVDAIHFDRAGHTAAEAAALPASRLHYVQLCDAPAERPRDLDTMLRQARTARLPPGEGGLDLRGLLRALPAHLPIAVEVPMHERAATMPALARATLLRERTLALLEALEPAA